MDPTRWIIVAGAVAAALTAIGVVLTKVAKGMYRAWRKVDAFLEDWAGEPERPGRDAVPAMPVRVRKLEILGSLHEGRLAALEGKHKP